MIGSFDATILFLKTIHLFLEKMTALKQLTTLAEIAAIFKNVFTLSPMTPWPWSLPYLEFVVAIDKHYSYHFFTALVNSN